MLCPEVWNFEAPQHYFDYTHGSNKNTNVSKFIKSQYFNHSLSLVIAGANDFPYHILENALKDCDYYKINKLAAFELLNQEFVESFVKKGEISLLSIGNKLDYENIIAITPTGYFILNVTRETYQKLGIEGKETFFDRKNHSRYVITINLKDDTFTSGKKSYDRILKALCKQVDLLFDVIVSWVPPEENICTSSVAAWFDKKSYLVSLCKNKTIHRIKNYVDTPVINKNLNYDQFFEWLGIFSIDGNLNPKTEQEQYVSSYSYTDSKTSIEKLDYFQYTGLLTRSKIEEIFLILKSYVNADNNKSIWCSMDVQGFADSPISWNLKEHSFYIDGDNSYTFVLYRDNYILRKSLSSNNKPKITQ